jgi:hypothetical protein
MNTLQTKLKELDACDGPDGAIEWAKDYDTLQQAWDNCQRGDWMLWLINKMEWSNAKDLRLMTVAFARQVQHLMKDQRSINALDVAEKYANEEATVDELRAARDAAWAACAAAEAAWAAWAAAEAARAAAWAAEAAEAAWAAAWAAWAAAWAADAAEAAEAAAWAAWAAAEAAEAAGADQANIIRQYLPTVTF